MPQTIISTFHFGWLDSIQTIYISESPDQINYLVWQRAVLLKNMNYPLNELYCNNEDVGKINRFIRVLFSSIYPFYGYYNGVWAIESNVFWEFLLSIRYYHLVIIITNSKERTQAVTFWNWVYLRKLSSIFGVSHFIFDIDKE